MLSLGTGIIWRPNIYDRVLLLPVEGPGRVLRPDTDADADADADPDADPDASSPLPPPVPSPEGGQTERGRGARGGPITTCPDLTAIRGFGISYALPHDTKLAGVTLRTKDRA